MARGEVLELQYWQVGGGRMYMGTPWSAETGRICLMER